MHPTAQNCPNCGAAVGPEVHACTHCGSRLATIACPACFGMMFQGARFCPHCGEVAVKWNRDASSLLCPSCEKSMLHGVLGEVSLHECDGCFGLWVDKVTFEQICRRAEQGASALPSASSAARPASGEIPRVRYVRCPVCRELMHRTNYAGVSNVVIDVCRDHGVWFDADELQRIVSFIREGGLARARDKQRSDLATERRRLQTARASVEEVGPSSLGRRALLPEIILAAGDWFGRWVK